MSDRTTAANAPALSAAEGTIEVYVATWNETDASRRQDGIARAWAPAARYRDPLTASDGHAGTDAMLAAVQAKFPGFVLRRPPGAECHNARSRFAWSLAPPPGPAVV